MVCVIQMECDTGAGASQDLDFQGAVVQVRLIRSQREGPTTRAALASSTAG